MVLTKQELIGSLQHEIHILLHLAGKIDRAQLGYKPTEKQRTTLELLQYLNIMGPQLIAGFKAGAFDGAAWGAAQAATAALDFDALLGSIAKQADFYASTLGAWSDADFREEIEMFGQKSSRGALLVNLVKGGHAAYRTQLFCYLKACGNAGLNTMNLWAGVDGSM
jgi:hypothetical protein